jgi:hypothetical protein
MIHRLAIVALLALPACMPLAATPVQTPAKKPPPRVLTAGSLSGVARAPVALAGVQSVRDGVLVGAAGKIISNDGASLITNDGGGLISNDGGSLRLLAAEDLAELPLANAVAIARDARTLKQLTYVKPAATDAQGRFNLKGLPAGVTVLVEILFVGQQGKALRVTTLAHVEAGTKPLAVGLASTLATAALTKAKTEGQIYLLKQQDIERTAQAMAGAMAKDEAHHAEAAAALAVPVDAKGAMVVAVEVPVAPLAPMTQQAEALASADPALAQQVNQQLGALQAQVPEEQQPLITAVTDSTTSGTLPAPSPPPLASDPLTTPPPSPPVGVFTAMPISPDPAPTPAGPPAPPTPPGGVTSIDDVPQILALAPLTAKLGTLITLSCVNAGAVPGMIRVQATGGAMVATTAETWTDTQVTFFVTEPMLSGIAAVGRSLSLSATLVTAAGQASGPAAFSGAFR